MKLLPATYGRKREQASSSISTNEIMATSRDMFPSFCLENQEKCEKIDKPK